MNYECICYNCGDTWKSTTPDDGEFLCIECWEELTPTMTPEEFDREAGIGKYKKKNQGVI
jgi:protein-arginine kinase activator protein McsA